MLHRHVDLAGCLVKRDAFYAPGGVDPQKPRVQAAVIHMTKVRLPTRKAEAPAINELVNNYRQMSIFIDLAIVIVCATLAIWSIYDSVFDYNVVSAWIIVGFFVCVLMAIRARQGAWAGLVAWAVLSAVSLGLLSKFHSEELDRYGVNVVSVVSGRLIGKSVRTESGRYVFLRYRVNNRWHKILVESDSLHQGDTVMLVCSSRSGFVVKILDGSSIAPRGKP